MDDDSKTFSRETLLDDYWRDTWAYLVEDKISPLLMGEWGGFIDKTHDKTGDNTKWLTILRDYMIEKHIHHTFWCFNENSGDTGGLLINDFQDWDEEKYALVKPALWQDENGVFISLDHQRPVGANGQSLSEYYGGTPSTRPVSTATTAGTTAGTTTTTAATETTDSPAAAFGDVNCDGEVDVKDCVLLARVVGNDTEATVTNQGMSNADCDGDGEVKIDDLVQLLRCVANIIPKSDLGKKIS